MIWSRKSLKDLTEEAALGDAVGNAGHLRRSLSALNLVALGVGGIVGAGIFILTGHAAAANAGPAITLSFVLAGIACAFAGLCYAEMASTVPVAGSAYTYAYATIGELVAWIIGWDLMLEYAVGAVTVAIGWSGYVTSLLADLGIHLPRQFTSTPFAYDAVARTWSATGAILNVPAMAIIAGISALLVIGISESSRFNAIIVAIKLAVIAIFIISAAPLVDTSHWVTAGNPEGAFVPPNAVFGV
jgi:APA family basic amino acid/polyamine antiporter